jgi:hypothetical protein
MKVNSMAEHPGNVSAQTRAVPPTDALDALKQRVLNAIETVSYPARRDTLVDSAREHRAAGDVVDALRALPDESYGSFSEVSASIAAHA